MLEISRGKRKAPISIAIYGVEGIGKTTFASKLNGALIIDIERGSLNYDVARIENIDSYVKLSQVMQSLVKDAEALQKQGIKTIVYDSLDAIENELLIPHVLSKNRNASTLAEMEWGKGYEAENREFLNFLSYNRILKGKGYNIVYIVHCQQKDVSLPDTPTYSHYELKLNKKLCASLKESVDMLLFFNHKLFVAKDGKAKASERVMITNHTAYADAKNRFGLDTQLPLDPTIINRLLG